MHELVHIKGDHGPYSRLYAGNRDAHERAGWAMQIRVLKQLLKTCPIWMRGLIEGEIQKAETEYTETWGGKLSG
jgi:hypothetical protein